MANHKYDKSKGKSEKYQHVYHIWVQQKQETIWFASIWDVDQKRTRSKMLKDERAAALWIDKVLLEMNREPVNILKRVK